ncbi:hypothetical protein B0H13DRAFT_2272671 [Mycena leptocephala]|nr:hypothetical protein B0H13DRAFT_2272671 [Mycena leptocephala]
MLTKVISSALFFLVMAQGAIAIPCGRPGLPACPTFAPCAQATNFAATHSEAGKSTVALIKFCDLTPLEALANCVLRYAGCTCSWTSINSRSALLRLGKLFPAA